jgi:dual specificity phosphatase 12
MEELDLTAEGGIYRISRVDCANFAIIEAIDKIASVRSVVSPIEFFLHQLEIFERCNFDLNPSKYPEYRRFLMNYNAQDMLGERY